MLHPYKVVCFSLTPTIFQASLKRRSKYSAQPSAGDRGRVCGPSSSPCSFQPGVYDSLSITSLNVATQAHRWPCPRRPMETANEDQGEVGVRHAAGYGPGCLAFTSIHTQRAPRVQRSPATVDMLYRRYQAPSVREMGCIIMRRRSIVCQSSVKSTSRVSSKRLRIEKNEGIGMKNAHVEFKE